MKAVRENKKGGFGMMGNTTKRDQLIKTLYAKTDPKIVKFKIKHWNRLNANQLQAILKGLS